MSFADKSSIAVRQRTSNSRMVFLSTRPSRCMPRTPSCTAAATSLLYSGFFIVRHLRQFVPGNHRVNSARVERQQQRPVSLQIALVGLAQIRLIAFRKAEHEHGALADPMSNDGAESAAPALAGPRHPLLDKPVPKISVDQPTLGPVNRLGQRPVTDSFLALKTPKAFCSKNLQNCPPTLSHIAQGHVV